MLPDSNSIFFAFCVTVVLGYIIWVWVSRWMGMMPPGPLGYPLIGNVSVLSNRTNVPEKLSQLAETYGRIFTLRFGMLFPPVVVVMGCDLNREVFITQSAVTRGRIAAPDRRTCPGLTSSSGDRWKAMRGYVSSGLRNIKRNQVMLSRLGQETSSLIQRCAKMAEADKDEMYDVIVNASTNAVISIVAGVRYEYDDPELTAFREDNRAYQGATQALTFSPLLSLLRFLPKTPFLPGIRANIISKRRASIRHLVETRKENMDDDVTSDLIRVGVDLSMRGVMSEEKIVEVLLDTYVAGVMPIANHISFAIVYLLNYPDVQAKCQREIDVAILDRHIDDDDTIKADICNTRCPNGTDCMADYVGNCTSLHENSDATFGRNDKRVDGLHCHDENSDTIFDHKTPTDDSAIHRHIEMADKERLPYVCAFINEVHRLGGIPLNIPHCVGEDITVSGYRLPKGTVLIGHIGSIHTDPAYWPRPLEFDPDRWIDDKGKLRTHAAFYPFALGPRMCVGKPLAEVAVFLFIANLLKSFTFTVREGHPCPSTIGFYDGMGGMKPPTLNVKLTPR